MASGDPWIEQAGATPVALDAIVSPLRYDVLVRRDFFAWLAEREAEGDALVRAARDHPYFEWFRRLWCVAYAPQLLHDDRALDAAFGERVRRTRSLYRNFVERGFDRQHPVTLRSAVVIGPTPSGKRLVRRLYAGDGCHRLALLMLAGRTHLEPGEYRVRRFVRLAPPDSTVRLLRPLRVPADEYLRFVAAGYGLRPAGSFDDLLSAAKAEIPEQADEVHRVLEIDRPFLEDHLT
jgi:hypothetical protein